MSTRIPGLAKPWVWVQPKGAEEILRRLLDAREFSVDERERENLCSVAHGEIVRLREAATRYRWLRKQNVEEFRRLYLVNIMDSIPFDELVDAGVDAERLNTRKAQCDFHDDRPDGRPDMAVSTGPGDLDTFCRPLRPGS